jgi:hypothetical protein
MICEKLGPDRLNIILSENIDVHDFFERNWPKGKNGIENIDIKIVCVETEGLAVTPYELIAAREMDFLRIPNFFEYISLTDYYHAPQDPLTFLGVKHSTGYYDWAIFRIQEQFRSITLNEAMGCFSGKHYFAFVRDT